MQVFALFLCNTNLSTQSHNKQLSCSFKKHRWDIKKTITISYGINPIFVAMKARLETKNLKLILSVFGLACLLLLSPCKIRNVIQAQVGLPQTTVLNKSQTTISTTGCVAFDVAEIKHASSTPVTKTVDNFFNEKLFAFHSPIQSKATNAIRISTSKPIPSTPLYILYQNILVYS